ncbi:MAG: hypothetical protein OZ921_09655 [Sorangiineae bacterium]|nr:hypothetical protein [Polyangiaceae bacterium]MEB2322769.1 hypothetical protein [Sorangiineae bacterium]
MALSRGLWLSALAVTLVACGGSSSETPPPLEPDLARLAPPSSPGGREPADPSAAEPADDELVEAAPSTWGSGSDGGAPSARTRRSTTPP